MKDTQPMKVLLIEHDPKERQRLQKMLAESKGMSYQVKCARQLSSGLTLLGKQAFDVAMVDLSLPDSDSANMVATVHAKAPEMPLIALTETDSGEGPAALAQGAEDYLVKEQLKASLLHFCLAQAVESCKVKGIASPSDERFKALIENAPDGIIVTDAQGMVRYYSPSFERLLRRNEDTLVGTLVFNVLHPDDSKKAMAQFMEIAQSPGASAPLEVRAKDSKGEEHWMESTTTNYLHDPAVAGIVINFNDCTDRKKAQETLRVRETFYQRLIEHVMDGIIIVAPDGTIKYMSPSSERQYGMRAAKERTGLIGFDFLHPEDAANIMQIFTDLLQTPGASKSVEARFKRTDGEWRWVHAIATNCLSDPVIGGVIVTTRDITDRRAAGVALAESDRRLQKTLDNLRTLLDEISTPVVQIWHRALALPLIGPVDDRRARSITDILLERIIETEAELVILDVTGVPTMDSTVIGHLMRTIKSVSMLGTQCILTGIRPEIAQSVVQLGLNLESLIIRRDLEEGLRWAIERRSQSLIDESNDSETQTPSPAAGVSPKNPEATFLYQG